jgi:transketolase
VRDAFIARLLDIAKRDPRIVLVTGDLGFGVLDKFGSELPTQFLNVGVAEQNMTGVAAGMALDGRVVFTYSIGNFPTLRCLEQIRNDAAYHDANVKIVSIGAGFSYGALGMSHHATEDLSIMRAIPGITVFSPGCDWEATEATEAMVRTPGTSYLRLDRAATPSTRKPGEELLVGKARTLREGTDLSLVATGSILSEALRAAEQLAAEDGIDCRVISVHTLRPFDSATMVRAARETGGIMTIEEHTVDGGLGGVVAESCLENSAAPRRFHRVGLRAGFSAIVGSQEYLRRRYEMDAASIAKNAKLMLRSHLDAPAKALAPK